MSRSGASGWTSGKQAPPIAKSQPAAMKRGQLGGAAEAALRLDEVRLAARRVAAQREDVLDPGLRDPVERRRQALGGLADAAQVGHRLEPESSFSAW